MLEQLASIDVITCWGTLLDTEDRVYAALEALEYDPDLYLMAGQTFEMPGGYRDVEFVHCGGLLNTSMIVLAVSGSVQITKMYRPRKVQVKKHHPHQKVYRETILTAKEHLGIDTDFEIGQLVFGRQW